MQQSFILMIGLFVFIFIIVVYVAVPDVDSTSNFNNNNNFVNNNNNDNNVNEHNHNHNHDHNNNDNITPPLVYGMQFDGQTDLDLIEEFTGGDVERELVDDVPPPTGMCAMNSECPIGHVCMGGMCIPVTSCATNMDCPPNQICQNGQCIEAMPIVPGAGFKNGDDSITHKRAGKAKYKNIVLKRGLSSSDLTFTTWLKNQFNAGGDRAPISGRCVVASSTAASSIMSITRFTDAACRTVVIPACDGDSKEPAYLTVELDPAMTDVIVRGWDPTHPEFAKTAPITKRDQKQWLPSNFRISITGLEDACKSVTRIEEIIIQQVDSASAPVCSELCITCPLEQGKLFQEWLKVSTRRNSTTNTNNNGSTDPSLKKTGTVKFFNDSKGFGKAILGITFSELDILSIELVEQRSTTVCKIRMVVKESYIEN